MNVVFGISLKVVAVLLFTLMFTCVKASADTVPPGQAVFFRSFFTLIPVFVYMAIKAEPLSVLLTRNPIGHAWRGILSAMAMILNFWAVGLLPLPDVIAISYAMPLFTTIFAALILGEAVRDYRWAAIAIGFAGVLLVLWPRLEFLRGDIEHWPQLIGALGAVAAAALIGLGLVVVRLLVSGEKTSVIVFYFAVICSAGSLFTLPWGWVVPSLPITLILILSGIAGGAAQILLTESIRYADMSTLAPFEYVSMLAAIVIGYFVFSEVPTVWMTAGALLIIAAGLLMIQREHAGRRGQQS